MPKYLAHGSYTSEGLKGFIKEGGTARRKAVEALVQSAGGKVEAVYWGFGNDDVYTIIDVPDNVSAAAVSMAVGAVGAVHLKTVVLLTAEEMDAATKKSITYRPPGS